MPDEPTAAPPGLTLAHDEVRMLKEVLLALAPNPAMLAGAMVSAVILRGDVSEAAVLAAGETFQRLMEKLAGSSSGTDTCAPTASVTTAPAPRRDM